MTDDTRLIPLTNKRRLVGHAIVDAEDYEYLMQWQWHPEWHGYATRSKRINLKTLSIKMHRIILGRILDRELQSKEKTDHINGDRLDNRRCNLRLATHAENMQNCRLRNDNTSGYKGVSWDTSKNKWIAQIMVNKKNKYLGRFDTPEEGHEAYKKAALLYYGEFANDGKSTLLKAG